MLHERHTTIATRANARTWAVPWTLLGYLAIALVALLPRVLDLGLFITLDEASFWMRRSEAFLKAIQRGNFADTAISTHPGVTTMWLGAAGLSLRRALLESGWLSYDTFATALAFMRLPVVLAHTLVIVIGYGLLRRMFSAPVAFLAALFWATDPFVIAYSRLLHVDALAGSFLTLSLLAACVYWNHGKREAGSEKREAAGEKPKNASANPSVAGGRWPVVGGRHVVYLVLSGIAAGLALLSKSPALAVVPVVGCICLNAELHRDREVGGGSVLGFWFSVLGSFGFWLAITALTVFALYPALWVAPLKAIAQVRAGVEVEGAEPHMLGNFFLGQSQDAPGPLYYPVALVLAMTPWVLAGVLVLPLVWRRVRSANRRDLAALALFALLFVVALTLFPKKFHRYLEPAFPALDVLAAVGIYQFGMLLWDIGFRKAANSQFSVLGSRFLVLGLLVCCSFNAFWWHPYEIAYYNPLLGGAQAGARTFLVGWGEGMDQVAAWLNAQPDITSVRVVSTVTNVVQPYMKKGAQVISDDDGKLPKKTGYVVIYLRNVQRGAPSAPFDQFYGRQTPVHTVRIHGVDYAWIYRVPVR